MSEHKKIVIVGATSAIATHAARIWAQRGHAEFVLLGRDSSRLNRVAEDLKARGAQNSAQTLVINFTDPEEIQRVVKQLVSDGAADIVLIAHGSLGDQQRAQHDLVYAQDELMVNGVSAVLFAEAFAAALESAGRGTLAMIGSVAGDRGRKSNYVYGAAKGLVTRYVQGLQHRFAGSTIKVVLIKPGPTETPMTAALVVNGLKAAPVDEVAQSMVAAIDRGTPEVYVPGKWWVIMMIIRHLPRFVFNKMNI
jgi:decaprenylphospho-beta-D-erythro-pentofuranosid-2-ulose 2-reductase